MSIGKNSYIVIDQPVKNILNTSSGVTNPALPFNIFSALVVHFKLTALPSQPKVFTPSVEFLEILEVSNNRITTCLSSNTNREHCIKPSIYSVVHFS